MHGKTTLKKINYSIAELFKLYVSSDYFALFRLQCILSLMTLLPELSKYKNCRSEVYENAFWIVSFKILLNLNVGIEVRVNSAAVGRQDTQRGFTKHRLTFGARSVSREGVAY
jgi:hypothetical protein